MYILLHTVALPIYPGPSWVLYRPQADHQWAISAEASKRPEYLSFRQLICSQEAWRDQKFGGNQSKIGITAKQPPMPHIFLSDLNNYKCSQHLGFPKPSLLTLKWVLKLVLNNSAVYSISAVGMGTSCRIETQPSWVHPSHEDNRYPSVASLRHILLPK